MGGAHRPDAGKRKAKRKVRVSADEILFVSFGKGRGDAYRMAEPAPEGRFPPPPRLLSWSLILLVAFGP